MWVTRPAQAVARSSESRSRSRTFGRGWRRRATQPWRDRTPEVDQGLTSAWRASVHAGFPGRPPTHEVGGHSLPLASFGRWGLPAGAAERPAIVPWLADRVSHRDWTRLHLHAVRARPAAAPPHESIEPELLARLPGQRAAVRRLLLARRIHAIGPRSGRSRLRPVGWAAFALALLATAGLALIVWRGLQARPALDRRSSDGLGAGWRGALDPAMAARLRRRLPLTQILFAPFFFRHRDVERWRTSDTGTRGNESPRPLPPSLPPADGAVLIHFHGGAFRSGRKSPGPPAPLPAREPGLGVHQRELPSTARPHVPRSPHRCQEGDRLGSRTRPRVRHRHRGRVCGRQFRGRHLASMAALTANDPAFQPGFEHADTSVTAAVALNGYYGSIETRGPPSSPLAYVRADAPPFFVVHGDLDTIVLVEDARGFVESSQHLVESRGVRGVARSAALVRPLPFASASRAWSMRSRRSPAG